MRFDVIPRATRSSRYALTRRAVLGGLIELTAILCAIDVATPAPAPVKPARIPVPEQSKPINRLRKIAGPMISVAEARALGPAFAAVEDAFERFYPRHSAVSWEADYYDVGAIPMVRWARTSDAKLRDAAIAEVLDYRTNYVEATRLSDGSAKDAYSTSAHWAMLPALIYLHAATGDTATQKAIGIIATGLAGPYYRDDRDERIMSRQLMAVVGCHVVGLTKTLAEPKEWGLPGGEDVPILARELLDEILARQNADGSFRAAPNQRSPFMIGLLVDALAFYHDQFEADPRIPVAVAKTCDFLWAHWNGTEKGFIYDVFNPAAEGGVAPDLNGLIVSGFGFAFKQTKDPVYRERGDMVYATLPYGMSVGHKQFNQSALNSHKYAGYRGSA